MYSRRIGWLGHALLRLLSSPGRRRSWRGRTTRALCGAIGAPLNAVRLALSRLRADGLVECRPAPREQRPGPRGRVYQITAAGELAIGVAA